MKRKSKNVFLVVHQGFGARYLLRTDIFKELKNHFEKIIIVTTNADEDYFKQEFQKDNIHVEKFQIEKCEEFFRKSRGQGFFQLIRGFVLNGKCDLRTVDGTYKCFIEEFPAKGFIAKSKLRIIHIIIRILRKSKVLRRLFLWVECRMFRPDIHKELFEKYKPDAVITTSLGNVGRGYDFLIMREAKKHGAKTVTTILSWDNTSGKGMGGVIPDHVIAWTEVMKQELMDYLDFPGDKISVGGIAHFDTYYREEEWLSKEKIFNRFNLDINTKLIVLGTKSPTNYPWNVDIAQIIAESISQNKISVSAQLLIRLHPLHFLVKRGRKKNIYLIEEYNKLAERYPFVKIDTPEILSDKLMMDMPVSEQIKLTSILKYTDVLVNMFSTLNIEASIMDVPAVNVVFEGDPGRKKSVRQSIKVDFDQSHNRRVIETGAIKMCYDSQELTTAIDDYLNNPFLNKKQREILVRQETGPHRGRAGKHIAEIIIGLL